MPIIETHALTRRFSKVEAVKDLTLRVEPGSVHAFLGPNGAGKTTTIKLLMNLLRPTSGEAHILGVPATALGPDQFRQIGYVSENQKQPEWMTVATFLDFCRPLYPTWDRDLEAKLLRQFDLPLDRKLRQLSRGMKMKAVLLSSLAYRPRLLVLDEPFTGLDPLVREEFVGGLLEITEREGWTIFLSSHDMAEVERLADTVSIIHAGTLRLTETVDTLENRFRQISIDGPATAPTSATSTAAAPTATTAPIANPTWLSVEISGPRLRYIEPNWLGDASLADLHARHPSAQITATPLNLRDILVALLTDYRRQKP
jgi:ABC-2 type transport system ATP-binding protein